MITLHLLRHGETVWHAENRYAGVSDIELSDRGRQQAEALTPWARGEQLDLVATSDLRRAVDTGRVVAVGGGIPHVIDEALREVNFGRGEGMTRREMQDDFPEALAAFVSAPATSPLPGGEPGAVAAERGLTAICQLLVPLHEGAAVAVVAHTTLIRLMLCRMLGLPLDDYRRTFPQLDNTTVTTVKFAKPQTAAGLHNACALIRFNAPAA